MFWCVIAMRRKNTKKKTQTVESCLSFISFNISLRTNHIWISEVWLLLLLTWIAFIAWIILRLWNIIFISVHLLNRSTSKLNWLKLYMMGSFSLPFLSFVSSFYCFFLYFSHSYCLLLLNSWMFGFLCLFMCSVIVHIRICIWKFCFHFNFCGFHYTFSPVK